MRTIYSHDRHDLFYIISPCAEMTSDMNSMFTLQRKLFLYVLQYLNINYSFVCLFKLLHFICGECLKDFCQYHNLLFFPLFLVFIKVTAYN